MKQSEKIKDLRNEANRKRAEASGMIDAAVKTALVFYQVRNNYTLEEERFKRIFNAITNLTHSLHDSLAEFKTLESLTDHHLFGIRSIFYEKGGLEAVAEYLGLLSENPLWNMDAFISNVSYLMVRTIDPTEWTQFIGNLNLSRFTEANENDLLMALGLQTALYRGTPA